MMLKPMLLTLLVSGCLGSHSPSTNPVLIEIENQSGTALVAVLAITEPHGNTTLYRRTLDIPDGARVLADSIGLLPGSYRLRLEAGDLLREPDVDLRAGDRFRFVVLEDVIAFQRGGR